MFYHYCYSTILLGYPPNKQINHRASPKRGLSSTFFSLCNTSSPSLLTSSIHSFSVAAARVDHLLSAATSLAAVFPTRLSPTKNEREAFYRTRLAFSSLSRLNFSFDRRICSLRANKRIVIRSVFVFNVFVKESVVLAVSAPMGHCRLPRRVLLSFLTPLVSLITPRITPAPTRALTPTVSARYLLRTTRIKVST